MRKYWREAIVIIICLGIFCFSVYFFFLKNKLYPAKTSLPEQISEIQNNTQSVTEASEEAEKMIADAKDYAVEITDGEIKPSDLKIKRYEQITFKNKSSSEIKIKDDIWGEIPLPSGENTSRIYEKSGIFDYEIERGSEILIGKVEVE